MKMSQPRLMLLCCAIVAAGCATEPTGDADLRDRVASLERGVDALAGGATPTPPSTPGSALDRLDADLRSIERRVAAIEADLAMLRVVLDDDAALDAVPQDAAGLARRIERRERMRDVTAEYRSRLAEIRREYQTRPTDPGRQQALREAVDWYRDQRRAVMRGE